MDCLGFVGMTDPAEIAGLPSWYCNIHRLAARAEKNVASEYVKTNDADYIDSDEDGE